MDVAEAIVLFGIIQGVALAFLATFEYMQVYAIRKWLVNLIPPGVGPDHILSEAVFGFMEGVAKDPKKQEAFFGFVAACGIAAWDQVKGQVMPGAKIEGAIEKVASKNPYAAVGVELIKLFGPAIMERVQNAPTGQTPRRTSSGSGKW